MAGATKAELVKFVKEEITQTEEALGYVVAAIGEGVVQHNLIYQKKKAEYEGALWAYNLVLDLAEDRNPETGDSNASTE